MTLDASGNLFVGKTSGLNTERLLVARSSTATTTPFIGGGSTVTLQNTSNTNGNSSTILNYDSAGQGNAYISFINVDHNYAGAITFGTATSGAGNYGERVRIDSSGNVGIGTSSPAAKLHIGVPDASVDGTKGVKITNPAGTTVVLECGVSGDSFVGTTSGSDFFIRTNNTARLKFPDGGGVQAVTTISVGNATPTTSGAGITFPATQSASSNANTLDDYEEGTWTPTITFGGASVGVTYNTTFTGATYTKIGNRVCVSGYLEVTNKGSSTGDASIGNLPFTSEGGATKYLGATVGGSSFTFANQFWARIAAASTTIDLLETTEAGTQSFITNSDFTNGTNIYFSATYTV
jgi:hypothetical protein